MDRLSGVRASSGTLTKERNFSSSKLRCSQQQSVAHVITNKKSTNKNLFSDRGHPGCLPPQVTRVPKKPLAAVHWANGCQLPLLNTARGGLRVVAKCNGPLSKIRRNYCCRKTSTESSSSNSNATRSRPRNAPRKKGPKQKATSGPQNRRRRWAQKIIQRIFGRWRDGGRKGFLLFIYATLCCY